MIRIGVGVLLRERWRIDKLVGEGGLATVWAATHERNGGRVAIEILRSDFVQDAYIRERFAREARLANRIKHPSVVRVIDDDTLGDGTPIIVMELLIGETLEDRRERANGVLPLNEVVGYMVTILEALEVAHAAGVIHRDLKPDNLFIEENGRLRVLDFGIARVREGSEHATQTGTVLGTLDYMPPEQASGRSNEVDARSDLYSLAATVFKLLTGEPVHFTTNGITEMMVAAMTRPARSIAEAGPGLPPALVRVIDRALRFDPRERWPNAAEMKHALSSIGTRDSPRLLDLARDMTPDEPTLMRADDEIILDEEATHRLPDKHALLAKYGGKVPKPPPAPSPPRNTPSSTPAVMRNTPSSTPAARRHTPSSTPAAMRNTPSSTPAARRNTPSSLPAASPRGLRAHRDSEGVAIPAPPPRRVPTSRPLPEPPVAASVAELADAYPGQTSDSYPGHHSSDSYPGHSSDGYMGHPPDAYPQQQHSSDSYPGQPYPTPGRMRLPNPVVESLPPPAVRFIQDPPKKKGKALTVVLALLVLLITFGATVYFQYGGVPWHLIDKYRP